MWFRKKKSPASHLKDALPDKVKGYLKTLQTSTLAEGLDQRYTIFDLETTGLNPNKDKVLSFAFIQIENGAIQLNKRFEGFLKIAEETKVEASDIHHITRSETTDGWEEKDFIVEAIDFISDSILVGHHVAFDKACLDRLSEEHFQFSLFNKTIDTAVLGARLESPMMSSYGGKKAFKNLDGLSRDYNITPEARHSASGDTYTTVMLFLKLLAHAKHRGIKKLW